VPSVSVPGIVGSGIKVPVSGGRFVPYANLDYAASAPCLAAVQHAVAEALPSYSSVHRGAGYLSQLTTFRYEQARQTVREFLGARADDSVIFTRNTTDAMNLLAHALPPGTTVVVFESEHHAALLPWDRHGRTVRLPVPESPAAAVAAVEAAFAALSEPAGPAGPRLLVVTAASNVTGEIWPVAGLARAAHAHGARIAVDLAQFAPHRPVDLTALDIDYAAFSGHKLYAPFGAGCLAGRPDWLGAAEPYLHGGGATAVVAPDGVAWAGDPEQRHEAGTPNVLGAIAIAAACEALSDWEQLISEEERLLSRLRAGLAALPGVCELSMWGSGHPRVGIVAFTVDGWDARDLAETLSREYGIGVRDGRFCAHLLVGHLLGHPEAAGCGTPSVPAAVRVSFGVGSTDEHIDRLLAAVAALAAARPGNGGHGPGEVPSARAVDGTHDPLAVAAGV
jgi:selenocysteine lyase/cysteine desulfurase